MDDIMYFNEVNFHILELKAYKWSKIFSFKKMNRKTWHNLKYNKNNLIVYDYYNIMYLKRLVKYVII